MSSPYAGWPNIETYKAARIIANTEFLYKGAAGRTSAGLAQWFGDFVVGVRSGINTSVWHAQLLAEIGDVDKIEWNELAAYIGSLAE